MFKACIGNNSNGTDHQASRVSKHRATVIKPNELPRTSVLEAIPITSHVLRNSLHPSNKGCEILNRNHSGLLLKWITASKLLFDTVEYAMHSNTGIVEVDKLRIRELL